MFTSSVVVFCFVPENSDFSFTFLNRLARGFFSPNHVSFIPLKSAGLHQIA